LSDIQQLELASGIKDSLINAGFLTIESILASNMTDLSNKVGVDMYMAQIILQEARSFTWASIEEQPQLLTANPNASSVITTTVATIDKTKSNANAKHY
jgi:uncharacterized membrane protein